jgi:hypothetical protein
MNDYAKMQHSLSVLRREMSDLKAEVRAQRSEMYRIAANTRKHAATMQDLPTLRDTATQAFTIGFGCIVAASGLLTFAVSQNALAINGVEVCAISVAWGTLVGLITYAGQRRQIVSTILYVVECAAGTPDDDLQDDRTDRAIVAPYVDSDAVTAHSPTPTVELWGIAFNRKYLESLIEFLRDTGDFSASGEHLRVVMSCANMTAKALNDAARNAGRLERSDTGKVEFTSDAVREIAAALLQ